MKGFFKKIRIFVFLAITLLLLFVLFKNFKEGLVLEKKLKKTKTKLTALQEEKRKLEEEIKYLSQPHNLEKEIRKRFNFKKAGEKVAVILPEKKEEKPEKKETFLEKIKKQTEVFFKNLSSKTRKFLKNLFLKIGESL